MILIIIFALLNSSLAYKGVPKFTWVKDSAFNHTGPVLNVKYPDNLEDDFAILEENPDNDCELTGYLMFANSSVSIFKNYDSCEDDNVFRIFINSSRLLYPIYSVNNGVVTPDTETSFDYFRYVSLDNVLQGYYPKNSLIVGVMVFYDSGFKSRFDSATSIVIDSIIEETKSIFSNPNLVTLRIDVVSINELNLSVNSSQDQISEILQNQLTDDNKDTNIFIFLTDAEIDEVGKAPRTQFICSSNPEDRIIVVSWEEDIIETSKSVAHEIGHLLGMGHDYEWDSVNNLIKSRNERFMSSSCTNLGGIMDHASEREKWTPCSIQDFKDYYNKFIDEGEFCLKEEGKNIYPGSVLESESRLDDNVDLVSPGGFFHFTLTTYDRAGVYNRKPWSSYLWSPKLWDYDDVPNYAKMHDDGNFVMYNKEDKAIWSSNTWNFPGSNLVLQDDGNLVILSQDGEEIWTSNSTKDDIEDEMTISSEEIYYSPNLEFTLSLQEDDNLVIKRLEDNQTIWSTNTTGARAKPTKAVFKSDGNLYLIDGDSNTYWSSSSSDQMEGAKLFLLNSGKLVIRNYNKQIIWSSTEGSLIQTKTVAEKKVKPQPQPTVENDGPAVDGNWGDWFSNSACSQSCGKGEMTLTRKCDNPEPENGGNSCQGSDTQVIKCNTQPCLDVDFEDNDWARSCGFIGTLLKEVKSPSYKCGHLCASTPGCTHYDWVEDYNDNGSCMMRTGKASKYDARNNYDGTRVCGVVSSLRGGNSPNEGDVFTTNPTTRESGPVCDNDWTLANANVVCKQLGFSGVVNATTGSFFGSDNSNFSYGEVQCSGSEKTLDACSHSNYARCSSSQAVGVICKI